MQSKYQDAVEKLREAKKEKARVLDEFDRSFGIRSRKCKNFFKELNQEMQLLRSEHKKKNSAKIKWLLSKYRKESKEAFTVPEDVKDYKNLKVFDPNFVVPQEVSNFEPEVVIIGDIFPPLDIDEKAVLSVPPKTAIEGILKFEDFKTEIGKMSTKVRWEIQKEEGEKLADDDNIETTEEDEELMAQEEARSRAPHDPLESELDLRKRRVTDTRENSRIIMP